MIQKLPVNEKIYFPRFLQKKKNGRGLAHHRKFFAIHNLWIKSVWEKIPKLATKINLRTRISHNFPPIKGFPCPKNFPSVGFLCPNNNPLMDFSCLNNSPILGFTRPNNSPILGFTIGRYYPSGPRPNPGLSIPWHIVAWPLNLSDSWSPWFKHDGRYFASEQYYSTYCRKTYIFLYVTGRWSSEASTQTSIFLIIYPGLKLSIRILINMARRPQLWVQ